MTDFERWTDNASLSPDWARRAKFVARFIPAGLTILDVGCGNMDLEAAARPGRYIPVDLVARDPRTRAVNLNTETISSDWLSDADLVTMLGVVEYLDDAEGYFKHAAASAKALLFTYCVSERAPDVDRGSNGWVNAFTTPELEALLVACGWRIEQRWVYESTQCVILAVPAAAETPAWLRNRLDPKHAQARESQPRRPELVVTGFFARGNCGDEALLQCAFEAFEATHDFIVSVDEHGAYPGFWDWYPYNRMRIVHQTDLAVLIENPNVAGLLICGGGLLCGFAANQAIVARLAGKKTAVVGIDLWKPNSPAARWKQAAIAQYFDLFDLVGIRHLPDESYEGWQNAKSAGTLFHCGDWALRLPTDGDPSIAVDRKQVFITLREHAIEVVPHGYIAAVEALIDQVRSHGFSPILLPFCPEDERFLAEMGLERLAPVERTWWNPRRVRQWIASSGAMLTVGRLHPLIFSAGTGTPVASVTLSGIGGLLNRQPGKLMVATRELGIVSISNAQELSAFLARPLPADPEKVMASRQRLDMMIDRLKDHFQVAP